MSDDNYVRGLDPLPGGEVPRPAENPDNPFRNKSEMAVAPVIPVGSEAPRERNMRKGTRHGWAHLSDDSECMEPAWCSLKHYRTPSLVGRTEIPGGGPVGSDARCPRCNGTGGRRDTYPSGRVSNHIFTCPRCQGTGHERVIPATDLIADLREWIESKRAAPCPHLDDLSAWLDKYTTKAPTDDDDDEPRWLTLNPEDYRGGGVMSRRRGEAPSGGER